PIGNHGRQVVAIVGDGSALYASEALWSAAHHRTSLLLVVISNRRYATLHAAARRLTGAEELGLFTLEPPVIDFSGLARLYGWRYHCAKAEAELTSLLSEFNGRVPANTLI